MRALDDQVTSRLDGSLDVLANNLFTRGRHTRFHHQSISAMAFHPGNVATNFAADATNLMWSGSPGASSART